MRDITIAMGVICALGIISLFKVDSTEIVTVLSYVVTAISALATGRALK